MKAVEGSMACDPICIDETHEQQFIMNPPYLMTNSNTKQQKKKRNRGIIFQDVNLGGSKGKRCKKSSMVQFYTDQRLCIDGTCMESANEIRGSSASPQTFTITENHKNSDPTTNTAITPSAAMTKTMMTTKTIEIHPGQQQQQGGKQQEEEEEEQQQQGDEQQEQDGQQCPRNKGTEKCAKDSRVVKRFRGSKGIKVTKIPNCDSIIASFKTNDPSTKIHFKRPRKKRSPKPQVTVHDSNDIVYLASDSHESESSHSINTSSDSQNSVTCFSSMMDFEGIFANPQSERTVSEKPPYPRRSISIRELLN